MHEVVVALGKLSIEVVSPPELLLQVHPQWLGLGLTFCPICGQCSGEVEGLLRACQKKQELQFLLNPLRPPRHCHHLEASPIHRLQKPIPPPQHPLQFRQQELHEEQTLVQIASQGP